MSYRLNDEFCFSLHDLISRKIEKDPRLLSVVRNYFQEMIQRYQDEPGMRMEIELWSPYLKDVQTLCSIPSDPK